MRTSGAFLVVKSAREQSYTHQVRFSHGSGAMGTTAVAELQNAPQGPATRCADLMGEAVHQRTHSKESDRS